MPCDARDGMVPHKLGDGVKLASSGPSNAQVMLDSNFLSQGFKEQSEKVAKDIIHYVSLGGQGCDPSPDRVTAIMRNLVEDALKERTSMMRDLVLRLDIQNNTQLPLLESVASSMFDDEMVNWGRIVTLHAFCAYVAKYCHDLKITEAGDQISKILAEFTINRLGLWIVTHGGWKAFEDQFPTLCFWSSSGLWKMLLVSAIFIGTLIAFYTGISFSYGS